MRRRWLSSSAPRPLAVVTFGSNASGQLGQGLIGSINNPPARVSLSECLPESDAPASVAAGWGHSVVRTREGRLLVSGRAFDGTNTLRFGNACEHWWGRFWVQYLGGRHSVDFPTFTRIADGGVATCAASFALTLFTTSEGEAYGFGTNLYGQTGTPSSTVKSGPKRFVFEPEKIDVLGARVQRVSAGQQHGALLTTEGRIWTFGKMQRGQQGREPDTPKEVLAMDMHPYAVGPLTVPEEVRFQDVSCGFNHTAALDRAGQVWVWGKNDWFARTTEIPPFTSQHPLAFPNKPDVRVPLRLRNMPFQRASRVVCGHFHVVALCADSGHAFVWSHNNQHPVRLLGFPEGCEEIACTHSGQTFAIHPETRRVWRWTADLVRDGRPGELEPNLAEFRVKSLSMGWKHGIAVVEED